LTIFSNILAYPGYAIFQLKCKVCDGYISNTLPSVEYSYFRRHCVAHVLPNPMEEQMYYYQCFYCDETFHHKLSFINHIFQHAIDEKICNNCDESFPNNAAHFAHQIVHGEAKCPNCGMIFNQTQTEDGKVIFFLSPKNDCAQMYVIPFHF